jgi:hypothetical protein
MVDIVCLRCELLTLVNHRVRSLLVVREEISTNCTRKATSGFGPQLYWSIEMAEEISGDDANRQQLLFQILFVDSYYDGVFHDDDDGGFSVTCAKHRESASETEGWLTF